MASRAALVISLISLVAVGWLVGVMLWWPPAPPPAPAATDLAPLSLAWGQRVVWVLTDMDRRLNRLEREILLHTDTEAKP